MLVSGNVAWHLRLRSANEGRPLHTFGGTFPVTDKVIYTFIIMLSITVVMFSIGLPDRQWRSSSFQESKKVRISRDLWPWPWPRAHPGCTLTWSPSCASFVAIRRRSDLRKSLQTDGRTDDGRLAMVLAHSWNELKMKFRYGTFAISYSTVALVVPISNIASTVV